MWMAFVRVAFYLCKSAIDKCMLCHGGSGIAWVVVVVVMMAWW